VAVKPAPLPTDELKSLGEKLQQAIVLTRMRVEQLPASRLKAKGGRIVNNAAQLFGHVSHAAMAAQGLAGFLEKACGVTVDDLFAFTRNEKVARGVSYAGVLAVNDTVKKAIDELAGLNAEIDRSVKHDD